MPARIEFEQRRPAHRPGSLAVVIGGMRIAAVLGLAAFGALVVPVAALVPGRVYGARPALRAARLLARLFVRLFALRLRCPEPEAIRRHRGLLFINHLSYLDPVVIEAVAPVRFLSTAGVRRLPFIGWIARAVGTVFVNRGDAGSRAASRVALVRELRRGPYPPIVVAPEGQIGPGERVLPFRHGAFEIAREGGAPILPVVLHYAPHDAAVWLRGEPILRAVWRLAARTEALTVTVTPLPVLALLPDDDAAAAAATIEQRFDRSLAMQRGAHAVPPS